MKCINCGQETKGFWRDRTVLAICEQCQPQSRMVQTETVQPTPAVLFGDASMQFVTDRLQVAKPIEADGG